MLPDEYTLDVELHLDANNVVTELKLTLENEIEGLTQEMLDAFASSSSASSCRLSCTRMRMRRLRKSRLSKAWRISWRTAAASLRC